MLYETFQNSDILLSKRAPRNFSQIVLYKDINRIISFSKFWRFLDSLEIEGKIEIVEKYARYVTLKKKDIDLSELNPNQFENLVSCCDLRCVDYKPHYFCMRKYIRINPYSSDSERIANKTGYIIKNITKYVAHSGNLSLYKKLSKSSLIEMSPVLLINGYLHCLRYFHSLGYNFSMNSSYETVINGHLHCLKYVHENGCELILGTCERAAEGGYLDCLKYALENGCPYSNFLCFYAARSENLKCLRYAHRSGCPLDDMTIEEALRCDRLDCLKYCLRYTSMPKSKVRSGKCADYLLSMKIIKRKDIINT